MTCHASVAVRSLTLSSVSRGYQSLTVPPGNLLRGLCHSQSAGSHPMATVTAVAPVTNKMVAEVAIAFLTFINNSTIAVHV